MAKISHGCFPGEIHHSYGHLSVITGYKWDYTFYKWGYKYLQLVFWAITAWLRWLKSKQLSMPAPFGTPRDVS